jgi:hypothetical protein
VLKSPHWLLATLVLCNAAATEVGGSHAEDVHVHVWLRITAWQENLSKCFVFLVKLAHSAQLCVMVQALPIFLDRLADPITAVLISITVVLIFGKF